MLGYKRERSVSEDSENTQQSHDAELEWGAEVLRALKHARWQPAHLQTIVSASEEDSSVCSADCSPTASATGSPIAVSPEELVAGDQSTSSCDSAVTAVPKAAQAHRAVSSAPRVAAPTRSYVWRNPSRRPTEQPAGQDAGSTSDEEAEPADSPSGSGKSDRDKEWAALTTWLRMNLHQPRTAKRVVLFVGVYLPAERHWTFMLNPALTWDDVSPETKLRLRTLPEETAAAFGRKYPGKVSRDWLKKTQKYRPPGSNHTVSVPLGDMVYSMAEIYAKYESAAAPSTSAPAGAATAATATATTSDKTSGGSPASPASFAAAAATAPGQGAPAVPPSMPSSASVASAALAPMPSAQLPPPPPPLPPTTSIQQQQQPFPLGPPKQQQKQQAKQQRAAAAAAVAAAQLLQQQHPHPHALPAAQLMASRLAAMPALAAAAAAAMGGPIGGPGGMAAPSPFLASALSMPLEQIMAYY